MSGHTLPPYSVRESARARHVRLTVTPHEGLVVVVPRGSRVDVAEIVASKRRWAERSLARVADKRALHLGGPTALLPQHVELPVARLDLPVTYIANGSKRCSVRITADAVVVSGPPSDQQRLDALSNWLDRVARDHLPTLLEGVSADVGVSYERCRITRARSRWGSCSSRRTISLNRNVLFFPAELAEALVLHELAHLRHMDHSPRYWAHLATLDPAAMRHRAELKGAGTFVPAWADA